MPGTPGVNGCALSCLVVNVNGMRSRNKRRGLFQRLRDLRYSIVVLCETHSTDDRETTRWAQEGAGPGLPWEGQAFWSHGTSSSRGVAILVRPGLAIVDPTVAFKDTNGRLLMVKFSSEAGHPWAVLGVYGPVEPADRAGFYTKKNKKKHTTQLREAAEARPSGSSLLMAGDDSPQRKAFAEQLLQKVFEHPEYGYNPNTPNAHPCIRAYQFHHLGSRNGHADISLARHSPAARQLAEKWVREGAAVEGFTLHARYAPSLRPVGTVRVLICDLPAGYEVQGITETLLTCAGYENASTLVVAEFLGTGVLASREVRAVGRSDFIVAFVDAPAGDQKLQLLPDHLFLENGKRVFVGVEGRDPQQRGFIPVGTPSPPPPPPPPARPSVASEPPASTRDREDPARGGVTRQEDPSNGSTAMQVDPTPAPFPLISAADFQALVQQGEALMRLADRPPGTWGSQEQHWGRLAGPRLPSAMDIDSTGITPETAPRAAAPTAQQRQQQSGQHTLPQQHQAEQQQQQQQQQQAQRQQQERQEQEQQQQRLLVSEL